MIARGESRNPPAQTDSGGTRRQLAVGLTRFHLGKSFLVRAAIYRGRDQRVVDVGENSVNVYLINRHYEVAPVLSMTEHEANNAILWISDKLWQSLSAEQKQWMLTAAKDVSTQEPKMAFGLERKAAAKLQTMGVKIVSDVDKSGFQKIADPYLDKLAKELGPYADKAKTLIRAEN